MLSWSKTFFNLTKKKDFKFFEKDWKKTVKSPDLRTPSLYVLLKEI